MLELADKNFKTAIMIIFNTLMKGIQNEWQMEKLQGEMKNVKRYQRALNK